MSWWTASIICVSVFIFLIIIQKIMRSAHPVRSAIIAAFWGIAAMASVNICSSFTSVSIPISPMSISVSAALGIPGVICLLLLQRIL